MGEMEKEIQELRTQIASHHDEEAYMYTTIETLENQLKDQHKVVKMASDEVQSMLQEMKKQQAEHLQKEKDIKSEIEHQKNQLRDLEIRNKDLENLLAVNKLKMVKATTKKPDKSIFGSKQRIISGNLSKYGKEGRRAPKMKHVTFVTAGSQDFIEWCDSIDAESVSRLQVVGVSQDLSMVNRALSKDEAERVFVFTGKNRSVVFLASTNDEKERWLNFVRDCGVMEMATSG